MNVTDGHLRQALQRHGPPRAMTNDILQVNIAELRRSFTHWDRLDNGETVVVVSLGGCLPAVIHLEANRISSDLGHADVADIDLFHNAPTAACAFEPQSNVGSDE